MMRLTMARARLMTAEVGLRKQTTKRYIWERASVNLGERVPLALITSVLRMKAKAS